MDKHKNVCLKLWTCFHNVFARLFLGWYHVKLGPNRKSSQTRYHKGMACLQEATAGRGFCNGYPIPPEEVDTSLKNMKCGKVPEYDSIHHKFLKNQGPRARKWLAIFLTRSYLESPRLQSHSMIHVHTRW